MSRTPLPMGAHRQDLEAPPAAALTAIAEAAEMWGAEWTAAGDGGRLILPVVAGLRRGFLATRIEITRLGDRGSRVDLVVEERHERLNRPAVFILLVGAGGAVAATLWPIFPRLLAVAPLAVVLAIVAWLLVVARLRNSGPEEFLELVAGLASGAADPG